MPEPNEASDSVVPKRRAWPMGLLLAIVQMGLIRLLGAIFRHPNLLYEVAFCLYVAELILGVAWWGGGKFTYQGRVLVFAVIFPVALAVTFLLVMGGICLILGKGIGG